MGDTRHDGPGTEWHTAETAELIAQKDATIAELRERIANYDKAVTEACVRLKGLENENRALTSALEEANRERERLEALCASWSEVVGDKDRAIENRAGLLRVVEAKLADARAERDATQAESARLQATLTREQELHREACERAVAATNGSARLREDAGRLQRDAAWGAHNGGAHQLIKMHHAGAMELWKGLNDLSFECDAVFSTRAPSRETYNRTFHIMQKHRQSYSEAARSNADAKACEESLSSKERGDG